MQEQFNELENRVDELTLIQHEHRFKQKLTEAKVFSTLEQTNQRLDALEEFKDLFTSHLLKVQGGITLFKAAVVIGTAATIAIQLWSYLPWVQ